MSKFFNLPVIGIDVSADFSMVAILAPNGDIYRDILVLAEELKMGTIEKVMEKSDLKLGIESLENNFRPVLAK
ncbi:MAG TPA: hypothetical protein VIK72_10745 [Clostridiaceae bacterium]